VTIDYAVPGDTYACMACDGQPTIYRVPGDMDTLEFIRLHNEWHRFRSAMEAMSRFLTFVRMEVLARELWQLNKHQKINFWRGFALTEMLTRHGGLALKWP
jgi:hypothetical protein